MIIKCKMCGGDLHPVENATTCECEFCGTTQTIPKLDNDRRLNLYDRANHFRRNNEYDKAMGIFEQILEEDRTDAEAYWSLVLCRYGIEYVEDPATGKRIPTVNRVQFTSILADEDYKAAITYADAVQIGIYEEEARAIDAIQKGILDISRREKPFDVFICYKETDDQGKRTPDSVLANDLYHQLTQEGFKVFFSRITLEDKLGQQYEPYIFAALNSARVMVALGTRPEYFASVWVKNEWSRYLALIKSGAKKTLVPAYKDMDPYDLPDEFSHLQAQDMGKLGFMQDLIRGIKKMLTVDAAPGRQPAAPQRVVSTGANVANLLKRAMLFLEDDDYRSAVEYADKILDEDAEFAPAYMVKVLAAHACHSEQDLEDKCADLALPANADMNKVIRFAEDADKYRRMALRVAQSVTFLQTMDALHLSPDIGRGVEANAAAMEDALRRRVEAEGTPDATADAYAAAADALDQLQGYPHAAACVELCRRMTEIMPVFTQYSALKRSAVDARKGESWTNYRKLSQQFDALGDFRDAQKQSRELNEVADQIVKKLYDKEIKNITMATTHGVADLCMTRLELLRTEVNLDEAKELYERRTAKIDEAIRLKRRKQAAAAEQERRRLAAEAARARKRRIIICSAVVIAVAVLLLLFKVIIPSAHYKDAERLLANGQYEEAFRAFAQAGGYGDAAERVLEPYYAQAEALLANGQYDKASAAFVKAGNYSDAAERVLEPYYAQAEALLVDERPEEAAKAFLRARGYKDALNRVYQITGIHIRQDVVTSGYSHTIGLRTDGTVVAVGSNASGQCDVSGWTNIVAVMTGYAHTVGIRADGTVVAVGSNGSGQCDVNGWTDIVAVAAGYYHTVGLRADGTVVAVGSNQYGQCDVSGWRDIVAVTAGEYHTVGLRADGMVVAAGSNRYDQCDVSGWTDIVAVAAGGYHTVGLRADGMVVAVGSSGNGQCAVGGWRDIVAVAAGYYHTVGLRADGTVVAVGKNNDGQCDVSGWKDIGRAETIK